MSEMPSPIRPSPRPALLVGVAFIAGTCVFAATFAALRHFQEAPADRIKQIADRKPTELSMTTLDGDQWSLADHPGKVVLINYFATWCGPCVEETPDLIKIVTEYAPKGVVAAAIALDTDADRGVPRAGTLRDFVKQHAVPYPILLPDPRSPLFMATMPIPQTMLIDRHGRTARTILGPIDPADLRASLNTLLNEP